MSDSTEKKIYTIQEIKRRSEHSVFVDNYDEVEKATISAMLAGIFGLINGPISINNVQIADLSKYPGIMYGAIGITSAISAFYIGVCIKEKIKNVLKIKELRTESGITKEEQRLFLEELVKEGNQEAIELFDYFYGEEKRKSL